MGVATMTRRRVADHQREQVFVGLDEPLGYPDGLNAYSVLTGNPLGGVDPMGLLQQVGAPPLEVIEQNMKDAYDRSALFWNKLHGLYGQTADVPIECGNIDPQSYKNLLKRRNAEYWKEYQLWKKQYDERNRGAEGFKEWLKKHPRAKYGRPSEGQGNMTAPGAPIVGPNPEDFEIHRPLSSAIQDIGNAALNGRAGPGSNAPSSVETNCPGDIQRGRDRYNIKGQGRLDTLPIRSDPNANAKGNAATAGANIVGSGLNEAINGKTTTTIHTWYYKNGTAGYFIEGPDGKSLMKWVGVAIGE